MDDERVTAATQIRRLFVVRDMKTQNSASTSGSRLVDIVMDLDDSGKQNGILKNMLLAFLCSHRRYRSVHTQLVSGVSWFSR
jgi:hypothetical protein